MLVMYLAWKFWKRTTLVKLEDMDLVTDVYTADEEQEVDKRDWKGRAKRVLNWVF
ncbi:hypothetical protein E4U54_005213 [Claviceps lovelessii]|nr:hypothetical protein E4U54_005213 [Claviceps lovelessii]